MTEMTYTTMRIGGALPADLIGELIAHITDEFYELSEGPTSDRPIEDIQTVAAAGKSLLLQGHVNHGSPDAVIQFCTENNLPYWLHFDAGHEWDAGIIIWAPGGKEDECPASASGYAPVVDIATLRGSAEQGLTLQQIIENAARFESGRVPPLVITEAAHSDELDEAMA